MSILATALAWIIQGALFYCGLILVDKLYDKFKQGKTKKEKGFPFSRKRQKQRPNFDARSHEYK